MGQITYCVHEIKYIIPMWFHSYEVLKQEKRKSAFPTQQERRRSVDFILYA